MNQIYIATDWHLYSTKITDKNHLYKTPLQVQRLLNNYKQTLDDHDYFIYLGDLCDVNAADKNKVSQMIHEIPGYKVFCYGNHDNGDEEYYKDLGFDAVCEICVIHNIVFSHRPVIVPPDTLNIHGHLHAGVMIISGYQHINAYNVNYSETPTNVTELIKNSYTDHATEYKGIDLKHVQDKFQQYTTPETMLQYTNIIDLSDMVDQKLTESGEIFLSSLSAGSDAINEILFDDTKYWEADDDKYKDDVDNAELNESNINEIKQFNDVNELSKWMKSNIHYAEFTKLKSPEEVYKSKSGSCHDQVVFEYPILKQLGLKPKIMFFIAYNKTSNQGGMTHSFCYYTEDHKICWFENSWTEASGIHKYDTIKDMKDDIKLLYSKTPDYKTYPYLEFKTISYDKYSSGKTLGEFVSSIMNETVETHPMSQDEEKQVADKYGIHIPGVYKEPKTPEEKLKQRELEYQQEEKLAKERSKLKNTNETASFSQVKQIVNNIPKNEHHYFYHGDSFKNSPYVKYRNVRYYKKNNKKYGAFIDVYSFDDPSVGIIVIAAEPSARGQGLTDKLIQDAIHNSPNEIKTFYWKCDKTNNASYKLAMRNGFIPDSQESNDNEYVLRYDRKIKITEDVAEEANYDEPDVDTNQYGDHVRFFNHTQNFDSVEDVTKHYNKYHTGPEPFIGEDAYQFEMIDTVQFKDTITEASNQDKKLYPVYVMIMHSGTVLANAIKKVTKSQFSHSVISFDASMTHMYSFGRKMDANPSIGTFVTDDISYAFYQRPIPYALYMVPCTASQVEMMKKRLNYFIRNQTKFKYDFIGLFKNYFGISDNPTYKYFCSRFVADILNAGRPVSDPYVKDPSLMRPEDFKYTNFAIYVTGGFMNEYNEKFVEKESARLLKIEEMKKRSKVSLDYLPIAESSGYDIDCLNPYSNMVLGCQLNNMDEAAFDKFVKYAKSYKIRFDMDGNAIISRREFTQLDRHFKNSLSLIKIYEKSNNYNGLKDEACKIYYMIDLITKYYIPKKVTGKEKENLKDLINLRSVMINTMHRLLRDITEHEPNFNFQKYYDQSKYGETITIPEKMITNVGKVIITALV